jgi:hypothetical protein
MAGAGEREEQEIPEVRVHRGVGAAGVGAPGAGVPTQGVEAGKKASEVYLNTGCKALGLPQGVTPG